MKRDEKKILLVDDDEAVRTTFASFLQCEGYTVFEADSGERALELLSSLQVDLILTEIEMESGNGFRLLETIRENYPAKPPLAFVTRNNEISPREAKARGAAAYFGKPFDPDHLLSWIAAFFGLLSQRNP